MGAKKRPTNLIDYSLMSAKMGKVLRKSPDISKPVISSVKELSVKNKRILKSILIQEMSDPLIDFIPQEFAQKFSLSNKLVESWVNSQFVQDKVKEKINELIGGGKVLAQVWRKVAQLAILGSYKHQKLLLEKTGEYTPHMKLEHDITPIEEKFRKLEDKHERDLKLIRGSG